MHLKTRCERFRALFMEKVVVVVVVVVVVDVVVVVVCVVDAVAVAVAVVVVVFVADAVVVVALGFCPSCKNNHGRWVSLLLLLAVLLFGYHCFCCTHRPLLLFLKLVIESISIESSSKPLP